MFNRSKELLSKVFQDKTTNQFVTLACPDVSCFLPHPEV